MAVPVAGAVPVAVPVTATATVVPPAVDAASLFASEGMTVQQNLKDCMRCCICQPNWQWTVHSYSPSYTEGQGFPTVLFIQEDAAQCPARSFSFWAPGCRKTTYHVHEGKDASGPKIMEHTKEMTCGKDAIVLLTDQGPVYCPMCCCLPYLQTNDTNGIKIGKTQYLCDMYLWVPKFMVEDHTGKPMYLIRPDTCCGGCCIECQCGGNGGRCCRVPFHIRDPETKEPIDDSMILWLWPGIKKACCQRNNYAVKFPKQASLEMRKTLMGSVILMDMALFEVDQNGGN